MDKPLWQKWVAIEAGEKMPALLAAAWFFMLMFSYQILRPIRETLVSELAEAEKKWLFLATFVVMLVAVSIFGVLVNALNRRLLVQVVITFFSINLFLFALWIRARLDIDPWLSRTFFVWVSVFNLFMTSLFWSVMVDLFSDQQGRRLFGPIAGGATLGSICGSTTAMNANRLMAEGMPDVQKLFWLVLLSALMLYAGAVFAWMLQRKSSGHFGKSRTKAAASGMIEGLLLIVRSRYLMLIAVYLALISFCGTNVYMRLTDAASLELPDRMERTGFFAGLNLIVQSGTLAVQLLIVGAVMRHAGLGIALVILPTIYAISFGMMEVFPGLAVLGGVEVMTRIGAYGFAVPSREVLFTVVSSEAKYKSKNFLDTVIFRGSDALASSWHDWMKISFGVGAITVVMLPVTLVWAMIGLVLERMHARQRVSIGQ